MKICTEMFITLSTTAKHWEENSTINRQMSKQTVEYPYNEMLLNNKKGNELLIQSRTWMNLINMSKEIGQIQMKIYCNLPFILNFKKDQTNLKLKKIISGG